MVNTSAPVRMSLPTPIRHRVVPGMRQLLLLRSIGNHGPDLRVMADFALEHDVPAIRRPRGKGVVTGFVRQLHPSLAGDVHHVDIMPARRARTVFAIPAESEKLAVR